MIATVAILGAGIGEKHLAGCMHLSGRFAVSHICDLNIEPAPRHASQVGAQASVSLGDVIADPPVDIVDICLPPLLHVLVALKAGDPDRQREIYHSDRSNQQNSHLIEHNLPICDGFKS